MEDEQAQRDRYLQPTIDEAIVLSQDEVSRWMDIPEGKEPKKPPETFTQSLEAPLYQANMGSFLWGEIHVQETVNEAAIPVKMNNKPKVSYLRKRANIAAVDYLKEAEDVLQYSSKLARISSHDVYAKVQSSLARAQDQGLTKKQWLDDLGKEGIFNQIGISKKNPWYWDNVFRTNIETGYNAGKWEQYQKSSDLIFALEYIAVDDRRTTELCSALNGTIEPIKSPFWSSYNPPNHYQCRSTTAPITTTEAEITGATMNPPPASIPEFPTKSFRGNPAKKFTKLSPSLKKRAKEYGIQTAMVKRERQIRKEFPENINDL